jgi:phosphonate transport system substrate-binding protein
LVAGWPVYGAAADRPIVQARFGLSSDIFFDVSTKDARVALEVWATQIVAGAGKSVQASGRVLESTDALLAATARDEMDLIALPTSEYLRFRDRLPVVPILVGARANGPQDEHLVLVRRDSGLATLETLAGKRLILQAGALGAITQIWLDTLLLKRGLPETGRFFGQIRSAPKASQVVLPVFFRQAEAAVVTRASYETLMEMNPQMGRDLTALAESPQLLFSVMCIHRRADDEVRRLVVDSSLNLQRSAAGRQVLLLFKVARVIPFEPAYLDGISTLLREHRALLGGMRRG